MPLSGAQFGQKQKLRHRLRAWQQGLIAPRLGRLRQHAPRPLHIPRRYFHEKPPHAPPLISIVTPSLNQGRFLPAAMRSVLGQDYPRLEYIVQDGNSTDETRSILQRFDKQLHSWESASDGGQADAINRGFQKANGEILAWLNADDVLLPGTLRYVARYFVRHPEIDVVYGQRILMDEDDNEIGCWILPPHEDAALLWRDYVPQETLFWRRALWERAGGALNMDLHFALDWDLLLRFHRAGAKFARLPRFLGAFRVHEAQKTTVLIGERGFQEMKQLRDQHHGREISETEMKRRTCCYLSKHLLCTILYEMHCLRY